MSYKLHLKRHANERDITCHLCGKSFSRPDALRNHLSSIHENLKAFYCRICSRTFKGHLTQHMRTHENVKSFGCSMCGSFFSQKSQLQVHYRIHSGTNRLSQFSSEQFSNLFFVRSVSGERPYRCQVCRTAISFSIDNDVLIYSNLVFSQIGMLACICPFVGVETAHTKAHR